MARPMPRVAPVTMAARPAKDPLTLLDTPLLLSSFPGRARPLRARVVKGAQVILDVETTRTHQRVDLRAVAHLRVVEVVDVDEPAVLAVLQVCRVLRGVLLGELDGLLERVGPEQDDALLVNGI